MSAHRAEVRLWQRCIMNNGLNKALQKSDNSTVTGPPKMIVCSSTAEAHLLLSTSWMEVLYYPNFGSILLSTNFCGKYLAHYVYQHEAKFVRHLALGLFVRHCSRWVDER